MLIEIQSDAFKGKGIKDGKIPLRKGLNSIIATESMNNSTGKSSFLLAIDFAFGGDDYAGDKAKIIDNIGHHKINFTFEFFDKPYHFSRSTSNLHKVAICKEDYSQVEEISINKFYSFLLEKYDFEDKSLTLRGAISPYFRISHKSPKELEYFLLGSSKSQPREAVVNLEKLFNRYIEIGKEKDKVDDLVKANNTFNDAVKRNFIHSSIKNDTDLKLAQDKIKELKEELASFCQTADKSIVSLDAENTVKIQEIEKKYRNLRTQKTKLENKIAIANKSLEGLTAPSKEELAVLQSFFPSLNVKKVYAVEKFHESLTDVLKQQITDEIQYYKMQLNQVILELDPIKAEYEKLLPNGSLSKAAFDLYSKKSLEIQKLYDSIENYKKGLKLAAEDSEAKDVLNTKEINVLNEIADITNKKMAELNNLEQTRTWNSPILEFFLPKTDKAKGISHYSLSSRLDSGDGTLSENTILFDLSVLQLTKLPAIAHDLFVRNELDEKRKEDCIKLYATEKQKQIFATFTAINNYSPEIQKIIKDNRVLELYINGGELYGTSVWE